MDGPGVPPRLEQILGLTASKLGTVRVRSALNPFLWLVGGTAPIGVISALFVTDPVARYVLLATGVLPVVLTVIAAIFFLGWDRDRLQSEEFVLEQRRMAILARKGPSRNEILQIDPRTLELGETTDPEDDQ